MNLLREVLERDVFPALGCTEPIAVAYAASLAGKELGGEIGEIHISVDPGVYKNGFAVAIPNTGGERGNLIAGVLGALIRRPQLKMEIMNCVSEELLGRAKALIRADRAKISCDKSKRHLYIDVLLRSGKNTARAVIEGSHTNLVRLERNGRELFRSDEAAEQTSDDDLRTALKNTSTAELVDLVEEIDQQDYDYIQRGIDMNLQVWQEGYSLHRVGYYISELVAKKLREDNIFSSCEVMAASAVDARMAGLNLPVMASGGSGNQGIVAILVPYLIGRHYGVAEDVIVRSIALSHLMNSYIKCFTGELSPLCGCSIGGGVGAAVAMVYQRAGKDMARITLAANNLISDLGGMLCDGAKEGCALKVASSTNSAIRAAHMALNNYGITQTEGFVGPTVDETIRNLSLIGTIGMSLANDTMLNVMIAKASALIGSKRNGAAKEDSLHDTRKGKSGGSL
ncbi:MAG: serine dehydratase subunit alpha family protein [Deltaproteobacteria bacterium]|nr:serine dehydratase subunit alpha family protein [Deltaproteobacteria bacterium]MBW2072664.1 serine dehydratase subunit alpha family protein [Deltaproteobacteria bacterium]